MATVTPTPRPKVLLLGRIELAHEAWSGISQTADILVPQATDRASFLSECRSGSFDGCVVAYRTFASAATTGRVDNELVAALPSSLRFICHNGAGYDQIDVPACTARRIRVSNVPTAVDDATADCGIFLMLGALRNFNLGMRNLRRGGWHEEEEEGGGAGTMKKGHDPQGKILGILGMGGVGRNMARKARAFGMTIKYHNRARLSPELEDGTEYCGFEELLRESDVLSMNLPLNVCMPPPPPFSLPFPPLKSIQLNQPIKSHTRHIISHPEFALMKPGIVIVNTARGAVIDEAALVEALDSGQVASCGLDVYEDEPRVHPGLVANQRVLLVPHMGTWTTETEQKMEEWTIGNVKRVLEEGNLVSIVPEQKGLE